jgi:hypothetical protein
MFAVSVHLFCTPFQNNNGISNTLLMNHGIVYPSEPGGGRFYLAQIVFYTYAPQVGVYELYALRYNK